MQTAVQMLTAPAASAHCALIARGLELVSIGSGGHWERVGNKIMLSFGVTKPDKYEYLQNLYSRLFISFSQRPTKLSNVPTFKLVS